MTRPVACVRPQVDIRQWVLVSDINPLTLWMFDAAYVRWCGVDYSLENVSDRCDRPAPAFAFCGCAVVVCCSDDARAAAAARACGADLRTCATIRCSSWHRGTRGMERDAAAAMGRVISLWAAVAAAASAGLAAQRR